MRDVDLERLHELLRVARPVLGFDQPGDPLQLLVHLLLGRNACLVLPVRGDTVLRNVVHFPRPDLYLKGNAVAPDDSRVQGAVHIGFGDGNVILEAPRNRLEHLMDDTQHGIALHLGIHDDTHGVKVINLVKALVLVEHLAVYAVHRLDASLQREVDMVFHQLVVYHAADALDEVQVLPVLFLNVLLHLRVADGVKVLQTEIFQLLLDLLHTEPVCKRSINLHGFQRGQTLFFLRLCVQRAHIVQAVTELDEDDTHVPRHGKQHLAQVLNVRLLLVRHLKHHHLGNTVHQRGNLRSEALGDFLRVGLLAAVLHRVVKQGGADGICIQLQPRHDFRHCYGVRDVCLPAGAPLPCVQSGGVVVRPLNFVNVVLLAGRPQNIKQAVYTLMYRLFHRPILSILRRAGIPSFMRARFPSRNARAGCATAETPPPRCGVRPV